MIAQSQRRGRLRLWNRPVLLTLLAALAVSAAGGCSGRKKREAMERETAALAAEAAAKSASKGANSGPPAAPVTRPQHPFPPLAPLPAPPIPADNQLNDAKVALGELLFFDDRLSGDGGTSCASCHSPDLGWGDGNALSRGYAGTQHWRNSQTLINTAYLQKLFWAGESTSLESQADSATTGNLAGNGDPAMIEERLAQIPRYVALFRDAFGVSPPTYELAMRAIASFERAKLIARDSPFDEFLAGDGAALSLEAQRGLALFEGRAGCIQCHHGPLLSDERYHHLGVPPHPLFEQDPLRQVALRYQHFIRGVPEEVYRAAQDDLGLYYTTKRDEDRGKFRTPPLRYLSYTAPYMHNGVLETLEDLIEFYDQGGGDAPNKSPLLKPLGLSAEEKEDLLAFLESLSGPEIRQLKPELPPYEPLLSRAELQALAEPRPSKESE